MGFSTRFSNRNKAVGDREDRSDRESGWRKPQEGETAQLGRDTLANCGRELHMELVVAAVYVS